MGINPRGKGACTTPVPYRTVNTRQARNRDAAKRPRGPMPDAENHNADAQADATPAGGLGVDVRGRVNHKSNGSARVLARALRERWPIPEGKRESVVLELIGIAEDKGADRRERLIAMKALIDVDRVNLDAERESQPAGGVTLHVQTVIVDHATKTTTRKVLDAHDLTSQGASETALPSTPPGEGG